MSLINQMLKDLDNRRGPVNAAHVTALQGMGLVSINRTKWHNSVTFAAWLVAGLLAIGVSYQTSIWWNTRPQAEPAYTPSPVAAATESEQQILLDTASTEQKIDSTPITASENKSEAKERSLDIPVVTRAEPVRTTLHSPPETVIKPVHTPTPQQKAERLFAQAQHALSNHQRQRGEHLLRQALVEYSRHIGARSQLATLLLSRQQQDKAEHLLAEGLITDAHQLALARPYAQLLAARHELVPALEALERGIGERQADAETQAIRAAILYKLDRHTESAAAYRQALQVQPKRALWWTGLAVALERDGQVRPALEAFRRAAELPLDTPVENYVKQRIRTLSDRVFND